MFPTAKPGSVPGLAPFAQDLMKASRSALIVAASVVGMPCGNPLVGFQRAVLQQFGTERSRVGIGNYLIVIAVHHQCRHGDLLEVFRKVGLRNATIPS